MNKKCKKVTKYKKKNMMSLTRFSVNTPHKEK